MIQENNVKIARWLLRIGLAFVYGYAAIEIYLNPGNFLKYIPPLMGNLMPTDLFLLLFGIFEILLVIWLLSGWHTEYAGIISVVIMMSIVLTNIPYFNVLFRNIAIAFASLVLFVLDYKTKQNIV